MTKLATPSIRLLARFLARPGTTPRKPAHKNESLKSILLDEIVLKRNRNERGAAVVEFAVVLPILLFILLSMVDFGRYFYVRISLSSASFEVADAISRGLFIASDDAVTKSQKMSAIINDVSPGIAGFAQLESSAQVLLTPLPETCPSASGRISVRLATPFNSISPINSFFSEAVSTTSMRCLR
ncbi:MAG: pilus assembly protein [Actinobacteria bacterium]|nr:pilus assembly protein [Actinomycetota bacterium]